VKVTIGSIRNLALLFAACLLGTGCLTQVESIATAEKIIGNLPPAIGGNPSSEVMVTDYYSFKPAVSNPNGDNLRFSILWKPRWASFDTSSGLLSGTPQPGDVGTYSNVTISVTDGSGQISLPSFAIIVRDARYGSVTLSWAAPTHNEDGSVLTDLDGYRLRWRKTTGDYVDSVTIENESITTYVVDHIPHGIYEFVATSFNAAGVESRPSKAVTKSVL